MSDSQAIILITGGTVGGIGFELAVQLIAKSKHVLLGIRNEAKRDAAIQELTSRALPGTFEVIDLDMADEESISAAAQLDALVNNAAATTLQSTASQNEAEQFALCFKTNATGPFLLTEAVVPLLKKSKGTPRILNVSSGAGSIRRLLDSNSPRYQLHLSMGMKGLAYGTSKAAANLITAKQAVIYGQYGFKVFAFSPGFVVSNASSNNRVENGAQPTEDAVRPMVDILLGQRDDEHGCFLGPVGQYEW
ncbi:hypothetical protein AMS68_006904 [Peltaster fructicola]|uniref:Uncharacterized protein n=1 Tax=Peltaster fructicola TaxID=286661 RepID=A0A6H0Y311_9PEZI|nr:hypothetical protein AMS68_006904 [Peltaster fructicola]